MWLHQARRGLRGLPLFALQHSYITRWAVCVPRRHLSLADLAKAFDDLGTSAAGHTPGADRVAQSPSQQTSAQRPRWRSEMSSLTRVRSGPTRSPASNNKTRSADRRTNNEREAAMMMPFSLTYAEQLRSMSEPALCSEIDLQRGRLAHANMLLCLLEVYRRLWLSQQQQQQQEVRDGGVTEDARMRVLYVSAAEAAGDNSVGSSSYGRSDRLLEAVLRVLAKISPIELEVYAERWLQSATTITTQSPHHRDTAPASAASERARMTALYPFLTESVRCMRRPFAYAFGTLVQQWLLTRAAALPLGRCIECIHLLVQQRLFYSDPLLLTLVDTVLVRRDEIDDMNALVLLFDSMLRCQNDMGVAMRLRQKIHHNSYTGSSSSSSSSGGVSFDAMASLPRAWHPLLNAKVHNALAERFAFLLESRIEQKANNGSKGEDTLADADEKPMQCRNSLATLTPTSFLFLTLALAKLWHFHDKIIAALLPGLADYLRHHPEQYYGSIMMLGRPENTACEPDVLRVLVHNLTQLLTRRGQAYRRELHAQRTLRRQLSNADAADVADDVALSEVTHDADGDEEAEDGSMMCDAAVGQADVLAESGQEAGADAMRTRNEETTATTAANNVSQTALVAPAFKVSLVDVHALSSFLTCLWHQYTLVLNTLQASPPSTAAVTPTSSNDRAVTMQSMQKAMYTLVCRLLDDVYSGVGSLEALRLGMSGPAIERLLRCLLRIGQQLASEQAQLHRGEEATQDTEEELMMQKQKQRYDDVYVLHHPLLVELTYVWTLHIRRHVVSHRAQPSSPTRQQQSTAAGDAALVRVNEALSVTASTLQPAWQQHVKDLLQSLLHAGLLLREVQVRPRPTQASRSHNNNSRVPQPVRIYYTMPDALLARTPRVQEAVTAVKKELARIARRQQQQRARRRQQQQQQQQQQQVQQSHAVQRRSDTSSNSNEEDDEAVMTDVYAVQAVRTPAVFGRFSAVMKLVSGEPV